MNFPRCGQLPWQNEGEDCTLLGHPYSLVNRLDTNTVLAMPVLVLVSA